MTKFKVGDKFVPRKPKNSGKVGWIKAMDEYEGQVLIVNDIVRGWLDIGWYSFNPDWCEKVEERPVDVNKMITAGIDWEQRRYEIAKECLAAQINGFCAGMRAWSYEGEVKSAIYAADELIDQLQKTSEN